jgi:transposase
VGDVVAMSRKERARYVELRMVEEGKQKLVDVAVRLGVSYRQAKRWWRKYKVGGAGGLVHGSRGRVSNRSKSEQVRGACLEIYREKLEGFGPTLAAEKLLEKGLEVDHETLRRWLIAEGLWTRERKRGRHRKRRPRKAHFGELVQLDGSYHVWFRDGRLICLMEMVDDATGRTFSLLFEQETTEAAMKMLWGWITRYGIPRALYTDRKNVYITDREPTVEEQLAGEEPLTAFGKACRKLGIRIIAATSPQAKGRVERKHGVYQDRFEKQLYLDEITTIEGANELLVSGFTDNLNRKFEKEPASDVDVHKSVPEDLDLSDIFAFEETRTVANDWTVRYENHFYQLLGPKHALPRPKAKVTMQRRLDGSLHITWRDRRLDYREVDLAEKNKIGEQKKLGVKAPRKPYHPPADHPWRHLNLKSKTTTPTMVRP